MKKFMLIVLLIVPATAWGKLRSSINHKLVKQVLAEENKDRILYAPWKNKESESGEHNQSKEHRTKPCIHCLKIHDHNDQQNFILHRTKNFVVSLCLTPYTLGHITVVPTEHTNYLYEQSKESRLELIELTSACIELLKRELKCQKMNVGINFDKENSNNLSNEHMSLHIVPRYDQESSFLELIGQTKLICWDLTELYAKLKQAFYHLPVSE